MDINKDIKDITLLPTNSIKEALVCLDKSGLQIILVCSNNKKLLGTVTDGDIRRGLLNSLTLSSKIESVMNVNPIVALDSDHRELWLNKICQYSIAQLPIVDKNNLITAIFGKTKKNIRHLNKVILMLGGLGSRLEHLTENLPKPMLKVGNVPILETIIKNISAQGFSEFIFCINYLGEHIKNHFSDGSNFGVSIEYIEEEKPLGTAGALSLIEQEMLEPVIVMNGDLLTSIDLRKALSFHQEQKGVLTTCIKKHLEQVPYGVIEMKDEKVLTINEKPTYAYYINAGIYVLEPYILSKVPKDSFYDMPNLINDCLRNKDTVVGFPITDHWIDIGMLTDYHLAQKVYKKHFGNKDNN